MIVCPGSNKSSCLLSCAHLLVPVRSGLVHPAIWGITECSGNHAWLFFFFFSQGHFQSNLTHCLWQFVWLYSEALSTGHKSNWQFHISKFHFFTNQCRCFWYCKGCLWSFVRCCIHSCHLICENSMTSNCDMVITELYCISDIVQYGLLLYDFILRGCFQWVWDEKKKVFASNYEKSYTAALLKII